MFIANILLHYVFSAELIFSIGVRRVNFPTICQEAVQMLVNNHSRININTDVRLYESRRFFGQRFSKNILPTPFARAVSPQVYGIATYDALFKYVLGMNDVRPSFLSTFVFFGA